MEYQYTCYACGTQFAISPSGGCPTCARNKLLKDQNDLIRNQQYDEPIDGLPGVFMEGIRFLVGAVIVYMLFVWMSGK